MTRLHLKDLPPAVRVRVEAQEGVAKRTRATRKASADESGPAYRCGKCPETFDHYGVAAERHMDEAHGGGRLEMIL